MLKNQWAFVAAVAMAVLITVSSPAPVKAQAPDPATQLYVNAMGVTYKSVGGPRLQPVAVVDIVDGNGLPVNGALVMGNWSGAFKENGDSDLTDTYFFPQPDGSVIEVNGRAEIWAGKTGSSLGKLTYFTFTITGVSEQGMTYVPVAGMTTASAPNRVP
jgi:hypothetical protein